MLENSFLDQFDYFLGLICKYQVLNPTLEIKRLDDSYH
uniref:Uncharacterized protein n=1 Tax=Rhizophora mucronata TaxID=61149 RepID=A0A2P2LEM9_RHIMU